MEAGHFYLESNNVKGGQLNFESQIFINDEFYFKQRNNWLREGDLVMVQSGHVGHTAVIPTDLDKTAAHAVIIISRPKTEQNPHFYNYQFQNDAVVSRIAQIATGNTIRHLLASSMKNFEVSAPVAEEQSRIGEFFRTLDRLVAANQRKVDLLQQLKRAYLQQLFPVPGETVPRLRFRKFGGEWNQSEFGALFSPIKSNSLSRADLNTDSGAVRNVHYGDILVKYGAVTNCSADDVPFITGAEISDFAGQLLRDGDVIIADAAEDETVGKTTEIAGAQAAQVVAGLHTIACRPSMPFQATYLGYFMNSPGFRRQLLPIMQGTKVLSLSRANVARTIICFPDSASEQTQIGALFQHLDMLIAAQMGKTKDLERLKRAYLQKMFV